MQGILQPLNAKGLCPILLLPDSGACRACASKVFCKLPDMDSIEVPPTLLPMGSVPGDRVNVELPAAYRIWLAFSLFILPLLLMLIFALLGKVKGEGWAMASGFAGLVAGFLFSVWRHRRTGHPRIQITRC